MPGMFQKAGKLVKLRSEVGNLESELETNLKAAVHRLPTACSKTQNTSRPLRKLFTASSCLGRNRRYPSCFAAVTIAHSSSRTRGGASLVPSPSLLPFARRSGPRSRIPWAYSRNVVRTNEIAGFVIITFWNAITER